MVNKGPVIVILIAALLLHSSLSFSMSDSQCGDVLTKEILKFVSKQVCLSDKNFPEDLGIHISLDGNVTLQTSIQCPHSNETFAPQSLTVSGPEKKTYTPEIGDHTPQEITKYAFTPQYSDHKAYYYNMLSITKVHGIVTDIKIGYYSISDKPLPDWMKDQEPAEDRSINFKMDKTKKNPPCGISMANSTWDSGGSHHYRDFESCQKIYKLVGRYLKGKAEPKYTILNEAVSCPEKGRRESFDYVDRTVVKEEDLEKFEPLAKELESDLDLVPDTVKCGATTVSKERFQATAIFNYFNAPGCQFFRKLLDPSFSDGSPSNQNGSGATAAH